MADETENSKELFLALRAHMKKEQFPKCIEVCDRILKEIPGDCDALRVKISSLIALDKIEEALAVSNQSDEVPFEKAYCLYRLNKVSCYQVWSYILHFIYTPLTSRVP